MAIYHTGGAIRIVFAQAAFSGRHSYGPVLSATFEASDHAFFSIFIQVTKAFAFPNIFHPKHPITLYMLPFLDKKKISGSIMATRHGRNTEIKPEIEMGEEKTHPALKEAAEQILHAVQTKSVVDLARALETFFYTCDSYPHEEGEHYED